MDKITSSVIPAFFIIIKLRDFKVAVAKLKSAILVILIIKTA